MIDVSFLDNLFSTLASSQRKYWRDHLREVTKCIKMWTILQIIQLYDKIYDMLECEMLIYRVCKKKNKVANIVLHQICGNHVTRRKGVIKKTMYVNFMTDNIVSSSSPQFEQFFLLIVFFCTTFTILWFFIEQTELKGTNVYLDLYIVFITSIGMLKLKFQNVR